MSILGKILVLVSLQVACGEVIFDMTSAINGFLESSNKNEFPYYIEYNMTNVYKVYYSTDLPTSVFVEEKLDDVLSAADFLYSNLSGKSKAPELYLGLKISGKLLNQTNHQIVEVEADTDNKVSNEVPALSPVQQKLIQRITYVILDWSNVPCSEDVSQLLNIAKPDHVQQLLETLANSTSYSVNVLTSYGSSQRDCWKDEPEQRIIETRLSMLSIKFSNSRFLASQEMFTKYWNDLVKKHKEFTYQFNTLGYDHYYLIELEKDDVPKSLNKSSVFISHLTLLWKFVSEFASHSNQILILEPVLYPTVTREGKAVSSSPSSVIIPIANVLVEYFIKANSISSSLYTTIVSWKCHDKCWTKVKGVSSSYPSPCLCEGAMVLEKLRGLKDFHIFLEINPNHWNYKENLIFLNTTILENVPVDTIVIYIDDVSKSPPPNILNEVGFAIQGRTLACCIPYGEIPDKTNRKPASELSSKHGFTTDNKYSDSQAIFKAATVHIWRIKIDLPVIENQLDDYEFVAEKVTNKLAQVLKEREVFLENNPGKKVLLHFDIVPWKKRLFAPTNGMYCSSRKLKINVFFEVLVNWASVWEVAVVFNSIVESDLYPGWFGQVGGDFVTRNYPSSMSNWLGEMDPCINQSKIISPPGITFNQSLAGISLDFNIRDTPLAINESEVILQLVMEKFSRVELKFGKDGKNIKSVTLGLSNVLRRNVKPTQFFIEVEFPINESSRAHYFKEVDTLVNILQENSIVTLGGVHVFDYDQIFSKTSLSTSLVSRLSENLKSNVKLGVSLMSCEKEYRHLTEEEIENFPSNVAYMVCNEKEVSSSISTGDKPPDDHFLDGCLGVRNAFKKDFPSLDLHFKVDITGGRGLPFSGFSGRRIIASNADILFYIADASKFSDIYGLSYFLTPAFSVPGTVNENGGWWEIKNRSDLADLTVYTEKEADHLGKTTWVPNLEEPETHIVSQGLLSVEVWTTVAIIGILLFVIVLVNAIVCRKMRKSRFLTEAEVREFLQGHNAQGVSPQSDINQIVPNFNLDYKVDKIIFKNESYPILGMGEFGTVYKATIGDTTVAVKVPKDGCSKVNFKSLLTEVKVFSHIGDHVNVVKFVGAYVGEIKNGVIQIATELCENGSLLSYLRSVKRQLPPGNEIELDAIQLHELVQFGKEIASGMEYIGSKNVVHGDLSTRNVLLDGNNTCKISDFGLARKLYEYNKYVKKSQEPLPWRWMSYESLARFEFTTKSDIWSYGVTLWEIFTLGDVPYPGLAWSPNFAEEILNGMRMPMPRFARAEICEEIANCWNIVPENRPEFEEMVKLCVGMLNNSYRVLDEP